MQIRLPTNTIELEPGSRARDRWQTRSRIAARLVPEREVAAAPVPPIYASEPEVSWTPERWEPGPCTCEEGLCDRDHEHE